MMKSKSPLETLRHHFQKHMKIADSNLQIEQHICEPHPAALNIDSSFKRIYVHYSPQTHYPTVTKKTLLGTLKQIEDSCQELASVGTTLAEQYQKLDL